MRALTAGRLLRLGAGLAALGVALGAFGAHGLKSLVTPERLAVFETGVRYHLVHALAVLAAAGAAYVAPQAAAHAGRARCSRWGCCSSPAASTCWCGPGSPRGER